ncbi:uncharacterized protein LOC134217074 [Armigeres subalbatus]|uniref:uncharacterized protein LOC134217074 n=1 Tax=Armigeres subalbatus TaxID=124917 RepID=UPI002ED5860C
MYHFWDSFSETHRSTGDMSIVLIVFAVFISNFGNCARVKEYFQEKAATCVVPYANKFVVQFPTPTLNFTTSNNIIKLYGNFTVTEVIQEPLEMIVVSNRCTLDMKTCEQFNKRVLTDICHYINDGKGLWAQFFRRIEPEFNCPVEPGLYTFKNTALDLSFLTNLPLEGYRWQTTIKLNSRTKPKRELYCLLSLSTNRWVRKPSR